MSKYLSITKVTIMESLQYRIHFICTLLGNVLYLGISYYIWKSIFAYNGCERISNMDLGETLLYVMLTQAILSVMSTLIDGEIARHILTGEITISLTKPFRYLYRMFFQNLGMALTNFVLIFLPTLIIIFAGLHIRVSCIRFGVFFISLCMGHIINFLIDYLVGITVFYTGNIWGIRGVKDTLITLLSGLLIPLSYFPDKLEQIIYLLPFHTIYDLPVKLFITSDFSVLTIMTSFLTQMLWIVILYIIVNLVYSCLYKRLSINGG